MSSRCPDPVRRWPRWALARVGAFTLGLVLGIVAAVPLARGAQPPALPGTPPTRPSAMPATLRVCADPDNLPYSHADGRGYEPALAALLAGELRLPLATQWQPQRLGFVRKSVGADRCDVWLSVPAGFERLATTRPYYRSAYALLTRADDPQALASLDDPRLAALRIGVQLPGNDMAATPPGHLLARRGAVAHVVGFPVAEPTADIGTALARHELDAAIVWGPQAGWIAQQSAAPLALRLVATPPDAPMPFDFAIAVGVKRGETALRDAIDAALVRRHDDVARLLAQHGVPQLPLDQATASRSNRQGGVR